MKSTVPGLVVLVVLALAVGSASSQQLMELFAPSEGGPQEARAPHWCATPYLMNTPEGRAALASFHEARQNGQLPVARRVQESYDTGQITAFNIISDSSWISAEFELKIAGRRWRAWLRSDAPTQNRVPQARFENMKTFLDDMTPSGSIDPAKGIIENDEDVFGDPPVYPVGSDGMVDILVYELDPGVAGFVSPADFDRNAADTVGNQSEIMYLDLFNFFNTGSGSMESVIAHEYQHIIHLNYDNREVSFVNEGQSEQAQEMNGYPVVPPFHLFGPNPEYNIGLFTWRGLNSADYTRASLWTGYLTQRIGIHAVGLVTQSDRVGLGGYQDALQKSGSALTVQELLADFHTANLINDQGVDPRFGYASEQRRQELLLMRVPASAQFDGLNGSSLRGDSLIVQPGGAVYLILKNVTDLNLLVDVIAPPAFLENRRSQMLVRAIGTELGGGTSMIEFNPSEKNQVLKGSFDEISIIFAHLRPESVQLLTTLEANWTQDPGREVVTVGDSRDVAAVRNDTTILAFTAGEGSQATRIVRPPGSVLDGISLAAYFFSQFAGNHGRPPTAPRDFVFTIWESSELGVPGRILYSEVMQDPLHYLLVVSPDYNWFDVDLDPSLSKLDAALPDTFFVGLQNTGTDDNFLIVWPSFSAVSPARPTGYIGIPQDGGLIAWARLWDIRLTGLPEDALARTVLPVRARFVIDHRPVAIESSPEVPREIELDQNYPNPFNPSTQIRFALPEASDVGLEVFDITGRRVANLVDARQAPGTYTVTFDATNLTSGVYFYRLTAGSMQILKRMVLLK